jgi:hypothetical protein
MAQPGAVIVLAVIGSGNPNGGNYWNSFANTEFYSSFIEPVNAVTTVQMTLVGYTGTIKAQAAENYQSIFYNVPTESTTYYNETRTIYMNIVGWHPILRLCFNNSIFAVPINLALRLLLMPPHRKWCSYQRYSYQRR